MAKLFADRRDVIALVGSGSLYALNDNKDSRPQLDFYANRIHHTRIFAGRLTPNDTRTGQTPEQAIIRLPEVLDWHRERNLRTEITCCTDTGVQYNEREHCRHLSEICQDYRETVIGVEVWNEWKHPSQRPISVSELMELKDVIAERYNGPIALGAAPIDELDVVTKKYPTAWTGFNAYSTVHLNRDKKPSYREAARIKEQYDIRNVHDCGCSNNEPGRFDHESLDGEWDGLGHERFAYILGCMGAAFNFMSIAHGSQIRDAVVPTGVELAAFEAFLRGASKVPRGHSQWFNANNTGSHPDSPIKSGAFMEGPSNSEDKALWRAYSYVYNDNEAIVIACGADISRFNLETQNDWELTEIVDQFAETQILWATR